MTHLKKLVVVILIMNGVSCQNIKKGSSSTDEKIVIKTGMNIGITDSLYSEILNQERQLLIYTPESIKDTNRSHDKYPVVYLLDGSDSFLPFIGMLKQYSELNDTKILPEMVVVAIPNINFNSRMMDFSPTAAGDPERFGGGDRFLQFFKGEFFPYIEEAFPVSENRTIVGHSLGGALVMNALVTQPEMFDNYLVVDGSLSFDNELFLKDPKYSLKGKDLNDKNIFIAIANTATYKSSLESIKRDTINANKFVRHSLELINQIEKMDTGLNMDWRYYSGDTHGSVVYPAQKDGFHFFYSWFEFKTEYKYRTRYFEPQSKDETFAGLTRSHFDSLSKKFGYSFKPNKEWLSSSAYMLLNFHKQPEQAEEVFKLNIDYYPQRASTYRDWADFYLTQNDSLEAKKFFLRSLQLKDHPQVRELIKTIE